MNKKIKSPAKKKKKTVIEGIEWEVQQTESAREKKIQLKG